MICCSRRRLCQATALTATALTAMFRLMDARLRVDGSYRRLIFR
jgi:hypothetical protein